MKYIDFTKKIAFMVQWRGAILNIVLNDNKITVEPVKASSKSTALDMTVEDSVIVLKAYSYQTVRTPFDIELEDVKGAIASELMTGLVSALQIALSDQQANLAGLLSKANKDALDISIEDSEIAMSALKSIANFAIIDAEVNNELTNIGTIVIPGECVSLSILNEDEIAAIDAEVMSAPSQLFSLDIKLDENEMTAAAKAVSAVMSALVIYSEFDIVYNNVLSQGRLITLNTYLNEQLMIAGATAFKYATIGDYDYHTLGMMSNKTLSELSKIYLEV